MKENKPGRHYNIFGSRDDWTGGGSVGSYSRKDGVFMWTARHKNLAPFGQFLFGVAAWGLFLMFDIDIWLCFIDIPK